MKQPCNRISRQALLAAIAFFITGHLTHLRAQTVDNPPPAADPKNVQPAVAPAPAPDHINLWNEDDAQNQSWLFHAQNTDIIQGQPGFHSPYQGTNSLTPDDTLRQTISLDLFFGAHIWPGGELYFNPEFYQGYGFDNTHGIANYPNGEAFKVGSTDGSVIIPRLFYRQTFGFGGEQEQLGSDELQLAQKVDVSRLTITVGKYAVTDIFDDNAYAHDQRSQFMSWALVDAGAFDFSADSYGFTNGVAVDFNQKNWALIWGHFMVPRDDNGVSLDKDFTKAWQEIVELDERYAIDKHPGTVRLLAWATSGHLGSYYDAVNQYGGNIQATEAGYRIEYGFALSADQEITDDLGVFTRLSWNDGHSTTWAFTDINQAASIGGQLKGTKWGRPDDVVGLADNVAGISRGFATYLNNGGNGIVVGDGHLSYEPENSTEAYYNAKIIDHVNLTGDFQAVENPGYNSDRGPIFILSARLHVEF